MVVSELTGLSPDEKKQAILKMSQFVLRESSANVRGSLYRRILEIGVYLSAKDSPKKHLDEILDLVEKQFFGVKLEKGIAEEYMKQLKEEGSVKVENGAFVLQEEIAKQLDGYSKDALALVSLCEASFIESVKRKKIGDIPDDSTEALRSCFYQFVVQLVSRYIVATARLLVKGTLVRMLQVTGENLAYRSTAVISDAQLRDAAKQTLLEWMRSPDEKFIEYVFFMRQNFLCVEVLNLDPHCRMLGREEFSKKHLFLDTNILLSLVVKSEFHVQTRKLVDNTKQLGCSLYVTKRTLAEFNSVLDKAKKSLEVVKATPKQLSKANNIFARSYGKLLLSGNALSLSEYVAQFTGMEKMLAEIGVTVLEEEHQEIRELPGYHELVEEVRNSFSRMRGRMKTVDVAEHDAFHLLLVKNLREHEISSFLGPNDWFLSYDVTLSSVDRFIKREFHFSENTTAVMVPNVWNEIISPFLIGVVSQKSLVEVLRSFVSSEFSPISEGVDIETMARLEIDWTQYDWLETEEIQEITRQKFVLDYISRSEKLVKTGDTESIERLRSEFNLAFSRLISQISNRKIEQVRSELQGRANEVEALRSSVRNLEETRNELRDSLASEHKSRVRAMMLSLRMRYISGIAGICLLVIGTILVILMKETASWQTTSSYVAFLIIGAILLLMAIAPERVSAMLGLGRKE